MPIFPPQEQGAIAQLGERLNGIQEVVGSIPISSTNKNKGLRFLTVSPCSVPAPFEKNWLPAGRVRPRIERPATPARFNLLPRQAWQWLQKKAPIIFAVRIAAQSHGIKETFCRADALHARFCRC